MDFVTPTLSNLLWLPVAVLIFLLPGLLLAKRLPGPAPLLAAFFASAALLFNLVLLLNALGLPLHAGTVGLGLGAAAVAAWKLLPPVPAEKAAPPAPPSRWHWLWFVPPAFGLLSIALRATIDPLSGYDNGFRWDYLARLVLAHRSLAGYPPVTAHDFEFYGWCDGIPPLVPLLNFWIYAVTGSIAPSLTAVRVVGEALLLGLAVHRYGKLLWGEQAGACALAALSASALALWSVAMGQETGLTALSLAGMLYFLEAHARDPRRNLAFWAAVAGAVGALSREYGGAFPLLGLAVLAARPRTRRAIPVFAVTAAALAAPWYLRNWALTGNPLYPHTLGGLFPGNAVHDEFMRYIADYWSPFTSEFDPRIIPVLLAALAGVLAAVGAAGLVLGHRRSLAAVAGIGLVAGLWACSVPETAGGWIYSMRVLLPALALLAVLGGWMARTRPAVKTALLLVLTLASLDAARRSWLLPEHATTSPWSASLAGWRKTREGVRYVTRVNVWPILVREAAGAGIVVDHPGNHALVTMQGGTAVPLFSPVLRPAFAGPAPFAGVLAQLRRAHIRFVALTLISPMTRKLVNAHPFWAALCSRYRPNSKVGMLSIFDLNHLEPAGSAASAP